MERKEGRNRGRERERERVDESKVMTTEQGTVVDLDMVTKEKREKLTKVKTGCSTIALQTVYITAAAVVRVYLRIAGEREVARRSLLAVWTRSSSFRARRLGWLESTKKQRK